MLEDARRIPDEAGLETDVCIVGGGAAGLTLALELRGSGLRTCVLEAGARRPDRATQSLLEGEGTYLGGRLHETRLAALGGTTRVWSGWCRPLERPAFEPRGGVIEDGWPFDRGQLEPFYARAHALCGLGPYDYDPSSWRSETGRPLELPGGGIETRLYQMSPPTRFGKAYRRTLADADDLRVLLRAVCTELVTDANGRRISAARVATLAGNRFDVSARFFVLAAGGIENPRLLLLSDRGRSAGLGNGHGLVGRYFMEHPYVTAGRLHLEPRDAAELAGRQRRAAGAGRPSGLGFYYPHTASRDGARGTVRGVFTLSPATVRRDGLLTPVLFPLPAWEGVSAVDSRGGEALRVLAAAARRGVWPTEGWRRVLDAAADPLGSLGSLYHRLVRPRLGGGMPGSVCIRGFCECHPRYSQRVVLVAARDRLGRRRTRVDWSLSPLQIRSLTRGYELLAAGFREAGIGRLEWSLDPERVTFEGGRHHMGTTRMHSDPTRGVVDPDGGVHDVGNLFVAGSSVFPTGGFANPTLTIVALAIRLADHLKSLAARDA